MQNTLNIAGLRRRLAAVALMLVLLGSFFLPFTTVQKAYAAAPEAAVAFGNLASDYTGVAKAKDGKWYRVVNGKADLNATGIYENKQGWWRVENGIVNFNANGVYLNEYGWWKTTNGKVTFKETGVFKNDFGWWYCKNSKVDFSYTGFGKNQYGWWRVENGKVNFSANGIFESENGWFKCTNGKVTFKDTGIYQKGSEWLYCKDSKVDFGYTGVASGANGMYYCKDGKVDFGFNGHGRNTEGNWCIANGRVQEQRNENLTIGTRDFTIQNGKINWNGDYFLQVDAPYSHYTYAKKSLASSGCGPVALVNAIYCLNGTYIPVEEVANWGYNNKYFNSDSFGGVSKKEFFTKAHQQFGNAANFTYAGYGKNVAAANLQSHLQNGGTAVFHVKYHFITAIDYDPQTNQYFVLDSYPGTGTSMPSKYRTTTAEGDWVTIDELRSGWLAVSEYWMYDNL